MIFGLRHPWMDSAMIVFIEPFNISHQGNTRRQTQAVLVFVYFLQQPMYNSDGFASMRCPEIGILKGSTNTIIDLIVLCSLSRWHTVFSKTAWSHPTTFTFCTLYQSNVK